MKVQIETVQDLVVFVREFGRIPSATYWDNVNAPAIIDSYHELRAEARRDEWHLATLSDTYNDSNGHQLITIVCDAGSLDTMREKRESGYGIEYDTIGTATGDGDRLANAVTAAIDRFATLNQDFGE